MTVVVADDGKGFEPEKLVVPELPGLGLRNIMNRVSLLGGEAAIDSAPGAGCRITIRLPQSVEE
jgi:signal transduction histidine kinase